MLKESKDKTFYLKKVKVNTPMGERTLIYRHVQPLEDENGKVRELGVDCDKQCPYGKICQHFPDPRHPELFGNKTNPSSFCDFCADLALNIDDLNDSQADEVMKSYVPEEGTIENNLGDVFPEINKIILEKNPMFRLTTIIDTVCSDLCEFYSKDHKECNFSNSMCLFRSLFQGPKTEVLIEDQIDRKYKTDREDIIEENPFLDIE